MKQKGRKITDRLEKSDTSRRSPEKAVDTLSSLDFPHLKNKQHLLPLFILAIVAGIIYFNTLNNEFVGDDESIVVNNKLIKNIANLGKLFDRKAYFTSSGEMSYRPLVTFTYFIDYAFYGLKPWGYHFTNLLLHVTNGAALYVFLSLLFKSSASDALGRLTGQNSPIYRLLRNKPFLIVLGFVSHPALTEAVNAISYREDLLSFLFYISTLSLYLAIKTFRTTSNRPLLLLYGISCITYFLALLSKEMAATLPLILYCYEWIYGTDVRKYYLNLLNLRIGGYIAVTLIYLYLRFFLFQGSIHDVDWSLSERLFTIPWLLLKYMDILIFPVFQSADYIISPVSSIFSWRFIIPLIILSAILFASRQNKDISFAALFFFLALIPVYNIVPIVNPFAERYLYLPVVGYAIIVGLLIHFVSEAIGGRIIVYLLIVILGLHSLKVIVRNNVWMNNYLLSVDTIKKVPESGVAHAFLGAIYAKEGRIDEAIKELTIALKIKPGIFAARKNLAIMYYKQGRFDAAISELISVLKIKPRDSQVHFVLGSIYEQRGRFEEALEEYLLAVKFDPEYLEAHFNLGNLFGSQGRFDDAINEYGEVLKLEPGHVYALNNMGLVYLKQGRKDEAANVFIAALKLKPDYYLAHYNLGRVYESQENYNEAINEYLLALRFKPDFLEARFDLALLYVKQGRLDEGRKELENILRFRPAYIKASQALERLPK